MFKYVVMCDRHPFFITEDADLAEELCEKLAGLPSFRRSVQTGRLLKWRVQKVLVVTGIDEVQFRK